MNLSTQSFAILALLMFLTGVGIPVMAAFNSGLGLQLGNPVAATFLLFLTGGLMAGIILMLTGSAPSTEAFHFERPYLYFGGFFVLFYILSITWVGPKIGIGNAVFFVLLGQLVAAAVIDHFGLWGALKSEITWQRLGGIGLMALGVYFARKTT